MKTLVRALMRYVSYVKKSMWTVITLSDRIGNLEVQLKIAANVKDKKFTFYCEDKEITLFLPLVGYDGIQNTIVATGTFYEIELMRKASKYIPPNAIIADCGCNIGNHSVYFAKMCNARKVISFDPQQLCASTCEKNMALNNVADKSVVVPKALGKEAGYMSVLHESPGNCGATRFKTDNTGAIPVITIDSLEFEELDFVKIDIEGGQLDLLLGAKETLGRLRPTIWIELLDDDGSPIYNRELEVTAPIRTLNELGYIMTEQIGKDNYIFTSKKP